MLFLLVEPDSNGNDLLILNSQGFLSRPIHIDPKHAQVWPVSLAKKRGNRLVTQQVLLLRESEYFARKPRWLERKHLRENGDQAVAQKGILL